MYPISYVIKETTLLILILESSKVNNFGYVEKFAGRSVGKDYSVNALPIGLSDNNFKLHRQIGGYSL